MAFITRFKDHFNDGSVGLLTYNPNGWSITESGTSLTMSWGGGSPGGQWWSNIQDAPIAYVEIPPYNETQQSVLMAETRVTACTFSGGNFSCGMALWSDVYNAYRMAWLNNGYINLQRGRSNSWGTIVPGVAAGDPNTTPHRWRFYWNPSSRVHDIGVTPGTPTLVMNPHQLRIYYSIDDGSTWTHLYSFDDAFSVGDFSSLKIGLYMLSEYAAFPSGSADFDYLEVFQDNAESRFVLPEGEPNARDNTGIRKDSGILDDETLLPTVGGPPRHSLPQVGGGQRMPGPVDQAPGSVGPFDWAAAEDEMLLPSAGGDVRHSLPQVGGGLLLGGEFKALHNKTSFEDGYQALLSILPDIYQASPGTVDSEGHPHMVGGKKAFRGYYYCAEGEPWDRPELFNFDGYGRDGREYIGGQPHPVMAVTAPWALESPSDDRSSRQDFPRNSLLVGVVTDSWVYKELNIYDLDDYIAGDITTLKLWMRFKLNTGNNSFYLLGNEDRAFRRFTMKNGLLCLVNRNNSARGGLITVDFKASGQDFTSMVRSDDDWIGTAGRDITDRNTTGNITTTGAPGVRIRSEDPTFVDAYGTTAGRAWVAVCGEDVGPDVVHYTGGSATRDSQANGLDAGSDGDGQTRMAFFGSNGWMWFSIGSTLYRNLTDYADGVMIADTRSRLNKSVTLPYNIDRLAESRDYIFAATEAGVYKIEKISLDFYLAYTAAGGGGGGRNNESPAGELLAGPISDVHELQIFDGALSGYMSVATYSYAEGGALTIIRLFDDWVAASYVYPVLKEDPGPRFSAVFPR